MDLIGVILIGIQSNILCHLDGLLNDPLLHNHRFQPGPIILIDGILTGIQKQGVFHIGAFLQFRLLCRYTHGGVPLLLNLPGNNHPESAGMGRFVGKILIGSVNGDQNPSIFFC